MVNHGLVYNCFSIKQRTKVTNFQRNGDLFMSQKILNDVYSDKALNRKIDVIDEQEKRVLHFRKIPTWGSQIFKCSKCGKERIFGHEGGKPENRWPLIRCEGTCLKNTIHIFVRVHLGREEK